jgi:hypothetical protein
MRRSSDDPRNAFWMTLLIALMQRWSPT